MKHPNIIYILADDMGYGDVGHLNSECRIPTPNLDRLGREGMSFTDAHASSAVCTPSRYSIMTGRYCWRSPLKEGVLAGGSDSLLEPGEGTVAQYLQENGYRTACVGKWHLGWDWAVLEGREKSDNRWDGEALDWIDYERPIRQGPTEHGFDTYFGIAGSLDMPPFLYVSGDQPVETPTAWGTAQEFMREGPRLESLRANNVLERLTREAVDYIEGQDTSQPFFLYFPVTAPHTPISPSPEFDGKSGLNPYADFCMELDSRVGEVLDALDRGGLSEDTMVIFTSDNGVAAHWADAKALAKHYGHRSSYRFRGAKSDIWEGGHRVPFMVRYPALVKEGSWCTDRIGIFDLFATVVEMLGEPLEGSGCEDSQSFLPALRGQSIDTSPRPLLVHHSWHGMFALRMGKCKICRCPGSGGWSLNDEKAREQGLPEVQLYDMEADVGEAVNRAGDFPEVVEDLTRELHQAVVSGSTRIDRQGKRPGLSELESWKQLNWTKEIPARFRMDD